MKEFYFIHKRSFHHILSGILFLFTLSSCQSLPEKAGSNSQHINTCDRLKDKLPDIKKSLDYAVKVIQPWVSIAEKKIAERVGLQSSELKQYSQKLIEEVPPFIISSLNEAGITITFHSTDVPLKVTSDCEVKLNLTKTIDVPGGFLLVRYGN